MCGFPANDNRLPCHAQADLPTLILYNEQPDVCCSSLIVAVSVGMFNTCCAHCKMWFAAFAVRRCSRLVRDSTPLAGAASSSHQQNAQIPSQAGEQNIPTLSQNSKHSSSKQQQQQQAAAPVTVRSNHAQHSLHKSSADAHMGGRVPPVSASPQARSESLVISNQGSQQVSVSNPQSGAIDCIPPDSRSDLRNRTTQQATNSGVRSHPPVSPKPVPTTPQSPLSTATAPKPDVTTSPARHRNDIAAQALHRANANSGFGLSSSSSDRPSSSSSNDSDDDDDDDDDDESDSSMFPAANAFFDAEHLRLLRSVTPENFHGSVFGLMTGKGIPDPEGWAALCRRVDEGDNSDVLVFYQTCWLSYRFRCDLLCRLCMWKLRLVVSRHCQVIVELSKLVVMIQHILKQVLSKTSLC